jgi:hypothetical protein
MRIFWILPSKNIEVILKSGVTLTGEIVKQPFKWFKTGSKVIQLLIKEDGKLVETIIPEDSIETIKRVKDGG